MQLWISLYPFFLVCYYWVLPESPRWLITADKVDKAIKILETAAKWNKLPRENIRSDVEKFAATKVIIKKRGFTTLFATPNIRKNFLCISYNWFVCGCCFFGVAEYMGNIGGNFFVNVGFSAVVQIPGCLITIWAIDIFRRKKL